MRFVNKYQSKEERRTKYAICRDAGLDSHGSRIFRDYRITKLLLILDSLEENRNAKN